MLAASLTAGLAHADDSPSRVVKSLFEANKPFNRHAEKVVHLNTVTLACDIDNERMREAHKEAFETAKAEIGFDALHDQIYLLGIRSANFLLPAGAHERFCRDALLDWGPNDPSILDKPND